MRTETIASATLPQNTHLCYQILKRNDKVIFRRICKIKSDEVDMVNTEVKRNITSKALELIPRERNLCCFEFV